MSWWVRKMFIAPKKLWASRHYSIILPYVNFRSWIVLIECFNGRIVLRKVHVYGLNSRKHSAVNIPNKNFSSSNLYWVRSWASSYVLPSTNAIMWRGFQNASFSQLFLILETVCVHYLHLYVHSTLVLSTHSSLNIYMYICIPHEYFLA